MKKVITTYQAVPAGHMSESFLQLGRDDRGEILQSAAAELGITAQILEKDARGEADGLQGRYSSDITPVEQFYRGHLKAPNCAVKHRFLNIAFLL